MPAVGAIPATARTARGFGHTGNGAAATLGEKDRDLALGMLPTTDRARNGSVSLTHRADGFKDLIAFLADIFINRHIHLAVKYQLK